MNARFPVLQQEKFSVSRRYEMYATPFAFLIDPQGVIASKGIINNGQHIGFVLARAEAGYKSSQESDKQSSGIEGGESDESVSNSNSHVKEMSHV